MPHQCVRCNTFFEDGAQELLKGCLCGAKLFFYVKKEKLLEAETQVEESNLTPQDRKQIENDIYDLIGTEIDRTEPVVLDLESIRILKPGKYEVDLVHLMKKEPLIFKLEDGKYIIDIAQSFETLRKK